jgi:hypothetical protein
MKTSDLPIPALLAQLIAADLWTPTGTLCGGMFNLGENAARKLSLDDEQLVLMPPPFHSIADEVRGGNAWWMTDLTNVGEIDYEKALIIADFGMGSDSPIILYYDRIDEPVIMYLRWIWNKRKPSHSWTKTHSSFRDFAFGVGLLETQAQQDAP